MHQLNGFFIQLFHFLKERHPRNWEMLDHLSRIDKENWVSLLITATQNMVHNFHCWVKVGCHRSPHQLYLRRNTHLCYFSISSYLPHHRYSWFIMLPLLRIIFTDFLCWLILLRYLINAEQVSSQTEFLRHFVSCLVHCCFTEFNYSVIDYFIIYQRDSSYFDENIHF